MRPRCLTVTGAPPSKLSRHRASVNAIGTPSTRWKFTGTLIGRPLRRPVNSSNIRPLMRRPTGDARSGRMTMFMAVSTAGGGGGASQTVPVVFGIGDLISTEVPAKLLRPVARHQGLRPRPHGAAQPGEPDARAPCHHGQAERGRDRRTSSLRSGEGRTA